MFSEEIEPVPIMLPHSIRAPFRLVNRAEILSVIPRNPPRLRPGCLNSKMPQLTRSGNLTTSA